MSETTQTLTLPITGMTCASCANHVRQALDAVPGVVSSNVSLAGREAHIVYRPGQVTVDQFKDAIRERGYDVADSQEETQQAEFAELRWKAVATGMAGAAAMVLSMPLMSHGVMHDPLLGWLVPVFEGPVRALAPWVYGIDEQVLRWVLLVLTALVMGWTGRDYYTRAWKAFRHRVADMNTLIATGTAAAFAYSAAATVAPGVFTRNGVEPDVYFEAVVMILALVLAGAAMETRARGRTSSALRQLLHL